MNGCKSTREKFTDYLDGRLGGLEMQRIGSHLDACSDCADEWSSLKKSQNLLARLGPVPQPHDLLARISAAVSEERARRQRNSFSGWGLAWRTAVAPFLFQATAGFASAVVLMGTMIVMVSMFAQPESALASKDEPLGMASGPRLLYLSTNAGSNEIGAVSAPVVVEAYVNGSGQVYDYRIVSGPSDQETRSQIENLLLFSVFEPARFFGRPVRGLAVLSFSGVSVRG